MVREAVTKEDLLQRAAELVPVLRERAPATETERRIPEETIAAFVDSGLLRAANPDRYGGYEAEAEVLFHRSNVHGYFMEYDNERAGGL